MTLTLLFYHPESVRASALALVVDCVRHPVRRLAGAKEKA